MVTYCACICREKEKKKVVVRNKKSKYERMKIIKELLIVG